jgi:hypothetical protein
MAFETGGDRRAMCQFARASSVERTPSSRQTFEEVGPFILRQIFSVTLQETLDAGMDFLKRLGET